MGGNGRSHHIIVHSIKGQSTVAYQQAAASAQAEAQSALNQDQVPRAYQGAVKNYFDDIKN